MSLQSKIIPLIVAIFLAYFGVNIVVQHLIVMPGFIALEQQQALRAMDRLVHAVERENALLEGTTVDWAFWDETYNFVQDRNDEYISSNIFFEGFQAIDIDAVSYVDLSGRVVWAMVYDKESGDSLQMPQWPEDSWPAGHPLIDLPEIDSSAAGLLITEYGPLLVASRPVLTSGNQGPIQGALIFGRFLDDEAFSQQMDLLLTSFNLKDPFLSEENITARQKVAAGEETFIREAPDVLTLFRMLPDVYGNPALLLRIDLPREIKLRGQTAVTYALLSVFGSGLIILAALYVGMQRMVIKPIRQVTNYAVSIGRDNDLRQYKPLMRNDEIGILSREFDNMVGRLARARSEKEHARAFLETAVEHSPSGIIILDAKDGRVRWVNSAALSIHGNTSLSQADFRLTPHQADWQGFRFLYRAILNGDITRNEESIIRNAQGQDRWVLSSAAPIYDSTGSISAGILVLQDITERIRADEDRKKLQAQLIQSQKLESVGKLAGGVAHDFNNMLSVILGYSEIALAKVDPRLPLYNHLKEIQDAASRSASITRQLLAFARKQTIAPMVMDLNEAIEGTLSMLRRLIGEDIDLTWHPFSGLWPVKIDPVQADQILTNLCVNARDAIDGVGSITIATRNLCVDKAYCAGSPYFIPGEYVMITASDDGQGMDKNTCDRVFEPFFTTKAIGAGTGLGLSTVYGIVKQNNGFINVYSEPGKGTTFRIYLPRHIMQDVEYKDETVENKKGSGETVLIVEDELSILNLAAEILKEFGYAVLTANSPKDAMNLVEKNPGPIHLLITDVVMPEMSGRDLVDHVQASYPDIKILFMSGYTVDIITKRGVLNEGVNFIQKPFSLNELADKVYGVLKE